MYLHNIYFYYKTKEVKADFDKQTKAIKQLEVKTMDLESQLKVNCLNFNNKFLFVEWKLHVLRGHF